MTRDQVLAEAFPGDRMSGDDIGEWFQKLRLRAAEAPDDRAVQDSVIFTRLFSLALVEGMAQCCKTDDQVARLGAALANGCGAFGFELAKQILEIFDDCEIKQGSDVSIRDGVVALLNMCMIEISNGVAQQLRAEGQTLPTVQ